MRMAPSAWWWFASMSLALLPGRARRLVCRSLETAREGCRSRLPTPLHEEKKSTPNSIVATRSIPASPTSPSSESEYHATMVSYALGQLLNLACSSSSTTTTTTSSASASASAEPRILVLISGSGTNLQALIDAALPGQIVHVVSNRKSAYGLTRAANAGISTSYHNLVSYKRQHGGGGDGAESAAREAYDRDLAALVLRHSPDLVVFAGWMHIVSAAFLAPLQAAGVDLINLHPALPGQFDGKDAIARAHAAFQSGEIEETGVMIHRVIGEVDRGEPVLVRKVAMRQCESLEELEARIHEVEHKAIVDGTRIVLEERRRRLQG
ncbi:formyl transferase-domain-containing protein [Sphaerosporella brunnea]|uniref:Phosphoribosylglycinamide formyltransferase n=1 Tax=Sphaerosporella brunnea TaxID=1250544 RepID=A0A5J5ETN0_9PEZI|nr:formyl transferase-domain-containing protein [Sphaerosporella brunnea]